MLAEILVESMQGDNLTGERETNDGKYELRRDGRTIIASVSYPMVLKVDFMKPGKMVNQVSYVISRNVGESSIIGFNSDTGGVKKISMTENPEAFGEGLDYLENEELVRFHEIFKQ